MKSACRYLLVAGLGVWALSATLADPIERETAFSPSRTVLKEAVMPLKLVVGVNDIYCKDSSCSCIDYIATRRYADFCKLLKDRYQIELVMEYSTAPYALDKSFREGKYDAVLGKIWPIYRPGNGRVMEMVRIADLQDINKNTSLWGVVLVKKESPLQKLSDLAGLRVAYGHPDAFEKHQAALALFQQNGVSVSADKWVEKASCMEGLDLLLKGSVDAAVISNYALTADCAVDFTTPEAFRVLGETEKLPLTSFMVDLKRVSQENALRLQQALVELSATQLPESMSGGGFVLPASWVIETGRARQ